MPRAVAAADPGSALPPGWQRTGIARLQPDAASGGWAGLGRRLDALQTLGVRGLSLAGALRPGPGEAGPPLDYRGLAPLLGSETDFDELLQQAHRRGLAVLLDYPLAGPSDQHPAYRRARAVADDVLRDWFVWTDSETAPRFNWQHEALLAWHEDNLRYWLNRGVDGFRLQGIEALQAQGPAVLTRLRAVLASYRQRWLVCDTGDAAWAAPEACGAIVGAELKLAPASGLPDWQTALLGRSTPFVLPPAEGGDPATLVTARGLLTLRRDDPALAGGEHLDLPADGTVQAFERRAGPQRTLVLINPGPEAATRRIEGLGPASRWRSEWPAGGAISQADGRGTLHFGLAPHSIRVLRFQP